MNLPPRPDHRPQRRRPAEEQPEESLTTQLFIDRPAVGTPSPQGAASSGPDASDEATQIFDASALSGGKDEADSTRAMSLDELKDLAKESHVDSIDGPRSEPASSRGERRSRKEVLAAERAAGTQAAPSTWNAGAAAGAPAAAEAPTRQAAGQGLAQAAFAASAQGASGPGAPGAGNGQQVSPPSQMIPQAYAYPYPERRRGIPGWALAIVLLCAAAILAMIAYMVVDYLGREEPFDVASVAVPEPATSEDAGAIGSTDTASEEPVEDADIESFASPSGNISCTIDAERARCAIADFDFDAGEAPEGCAVDYGSVVVANNDGAGYSCEESPDGAPAATSLDYGKTVSAHGMTCTSSEEGMSCASDSTGKGFTLARAAATFEN